MPEFEKSKGFKMKGPTFFKSALKKYNKPSPAKQGKFGKALGGVLTGGLSTAIGAIRKKRQAKKAAGGATGVLGGAAGALGGAQVDPAAAAAGVPPEVPGPVMKKGKKKSPAKQVGPTLPGKEVSVKTPRKGKPYSA